jgi:hypothetical protein
VYAKLFTAELPFVHEFLHPIEVDCFVHSRAWQASTLIPYCSSVEPIIEAAYQLYPPRAMKRDHVPFSKARLVFCKQTKSASDLCLASWLDWLRGFEDTWIIGYVPGALLSSQADLINPPRSLLLRTLGPPRSTGLCSQSRRTV